MTKVVIIGSGIIGSSIAYELSHNRQLDITLLDAKNPGTGSTGSALGILMGIISQKTKGRAWQLRESSLQRYQTLIPKLEALTDIKIHQNQHGIVKLLFAEEEVAKYQKLSQIRAQQGYDLQLWDNKTLKTKCIEVNTDSIIGAVYSPHDRQIKPTALTNALVRGASLQGVKCLFGQTVEKIEASHTATDQQIIHLSNNSLSADWIILATGLGTSPLIKSLGCDFVPIKPVLGQALLVKHNHWQHQADFNPVITGNDIHIAPMKDDEFWLGATVEFPSTDSESIASEELLSHLHQKAISFCPSLADSPIMLSWTGKRPRPEGKPAPIIERLGEYPQIILATGHYRNGILLAPATANCVASMITAEK